MVRQSAAPFNFTLLAIVLMLVPNAAPAWQQQVHYTMDVALDAPGHALSGRQHLVYTNNSTDTLREVYYHLFYDAFRPGSMMDVRNRTIPDTRDYGIWRLLPSEQGAVTIQSLTQDGKSLVWTSSETVLRVPLARPLLPGDSTSLDMTWQTQIPRLRRRGGWMSGEGVEFSMAQWYPKLAEYDERGWHADEYVYREFYGVYGTFDVSITLPATYVVGGTGTVMNPVEVGCGYELGAADTTIIDPASGTGDKTWRFHAENVHDFAWVADREYVHEMTAWDGIRIHLLYKRSARPFWRGLAGAAANLIRYYSTRFGRYAWPQFTVAMGSDNGMEYPQLVMMPGYHPLSSLVRTLAHEGGHQWFYGMVGNNETHEAWLDEGLTQYLTNEATRRLFGAAAPPLTGLGAMVYPRDDSRWRDDYAYYRLAVTLEDEPLTTFHDRFRSDATSGLVYFKGELVVRMLEQMIGQPLFDSAMRRYVDEWRFHHPTRFDFQRSIEETSRMRLDWFFNQWIESQRTCDYSFTSIESTPDETGSGYRTSIRLRREGEIIMPLDITLYFDDGTSALATVPVEEWWKPDVPVKLPRWLWVAPEYSATFTTPRRVVRGVIDTSLILPDLDRTDNEVSTGFLSGTLPPSHVALYRRWDLLRPHDRYSIRLRPTVSYSEAGGAQLGLMADGGYTFDRYQARLGVAYNLGSKLIDFDARYATPFPSLGIRSVLALSASRSDGVAALGASLATSIGTMSRSGGTVHRAGIQIEREWLAGVTYPNAVALWDSEPENVLGLSYDVASSARDGAAINAHALATASVDAPNRFAQWQIAADGSAPVGTFDLTGDLFVGGSEGRPPAQRMYNPAGATSREMHRNVVHRLAMNIRPAFAARNHLTLPTQGFLLSLASIPPRERLARSLLDARLMLGSFNPFRRILELPYLEELDVRLYAAAGWAFRDGFTSARFSEISTEAGVMVAVDPLELLLPDVVVAALDPPAPVRLSLWMPLYARSPSLDREGFAWRWAIGVSTEY